jgi:ribosomal-protein-alanine N-acetyltransferase
MEVKDQPYEIAVKLVEMDKSHVPEVVQIENDSFSTPWSATIFMRALRDEKTRTIVALLDERVVGYAVFWIVGDYAELSDIAVEEMWRQRGIGEMLVTAVVEGCSVLGVRSLFLEVRESNIPARKLYEKKDFSEITRRRRYYTNPVEDALVFGLDVKAGENREGSSG